MPACLFALRPGRNWTESQMILEDVAHYDTAVFVGGAMVIDTKAQRTLHRMGMEPRLAREVCATIESLGHAALALQDTEQAGVDYLASADREMNEATRQWMLVTTGHGPIRARAIKLPARAHDPRGPGRHQRTR